MAVKRVDDRSSAIVYAGGWGMGGAAVDYNDSVSYATLAGQTATLVFQGIGISVFGHTMAVSPGVPAPVSSYSIDGGTPTIVDQVQDGSEHPDQQYYASPTLSNSQHTLVVTNVLGNHAAYFLDYFLVVSGGDTTSSSPAPVVATVVNTAVTPAGTSKSSSDAGNPSAVSSTTSAVNASKILSTMNINGTPYTVTAIPSSSSGPVNPLSTSSSALIPDSQNSNLTRETRIIVGSVIGAFAAVVLLLAVMFFWLRKRWRRNVYDWRTVSEYSQQPRLSQWYQVPGPGPFAGTHQKFRTYSTQIAESQSESHGHSTSAVRPPSYSQEPPMYNPAHTSYTHSAGPSKFGYLDSPS